MRSQFPFAQAQQIVPDTDHLLQQDDFGVFVETSSSGSCTRTSGYSSNDYKLHGDQILGYELLQMDDCLAFCLVFILFYCENLSFMMDV